MNVSDFLYGKRTKQKRCDEGGGHTGGTKQHCMAQSELSLWKPAKDHSSYGGQEANNSGLNLNTHTYTHTHITTVYMAINCS